MTTIGRGRMAALACLAAVASMAVACSSGDTTAEPVGDPVADTSAETTAATTDSPDDAAADTTAEAPSWLFTVTSTGGTFSTDADGTQTLTLSGIDPGVTAFTDRPDRDAAVVPADRFVQEWPSMFEDSAPNAVLVEHEPSGESDSFVVTLFDPVLDGNTLSFTAEIVDGEDHSEQIPGLTATPHREPPASFRTVSLFIDSVGGMQSGNCSAPPAPGVNWYRCDLSDANLPSANLSSANLGLADLAWANLAGANLSHADMSGINLSHANLKGANLTGADLSYANLTGANLTGANVSGANLSNIKWGETTCPNGSPQAHANPCPV
jgi:hypothetical protein